MTFCRALVICLTGCSLASCYSHVQLSAPPKTGSLEVRKKAASQIQATRMQQTHTTIISGWVVSGSSVTTDYLQLKNGKRVYYPEDLLLVVNDSSPCALAVQESLSMRRATQALQWSALGGTLLSGVLLLTDIGSDADFPTPSFVGSTVSLVGGIVAYLVGLYTQRQSEDAKASAFSTYNDALLNNLGLCDDSKGGLIDCTE
jgi:hypothetical protein